MPKRITSFRSPLEAPSRMSLANCSATLRFSSELAYNTWMAQARSHKIHLSQGENTHRVDDDAETPVGPS